MKVVSTGNQGDRPKPRRDGETERCRRDTSEVGLSGLIVTVPTGVTHSEIRTGESTETYLLSKDVVLLSPFERRTLGA